MLHPQRHCAPAGAVQQPWVRSLQSQGIRQGSRFLPKSNRDVQSSESVSAGGGKAIRPDKYCLLGQGGGGGCDCGGQVSDDSLQPGQTGRGTKQSGICANDIPVYREGGSGISFRSTEQPCRTTQIIFRHFCVSGKYARSKESMKRPGDGTMTLCWLMTRIPR